MTSEILRYRLEVTDYQEISMPQAHRILSVKPGRYQGSDYSIDLWALMTNSPVMVQVPVVIVGTGKPIPDLIALATQFVDTAVMDDKLVWHVFVGHTPFPSEIQL